MFRIFALRILPYSSTTVRAAGFCDKSEAGLILWPLDIALQEYVRIFGIVMFGCHTRVQYTGRDTSALRLVDSIAGHYG